MRGKDLCASIVEEVHTVLVHKVTIDSAKRFISTTVLTFELPKLTD
jgi:hypothetical protein